MSSIVFGLTGSIACGKSTVSKTFVKHGIPVVDADLCARDVVVPGSIGLAQIIEEFGEDILSDNGTLNRTKLGSLCFGNPENLHRINSIMRPLIDDHSNYLIDTYKRAGNSLICMDAALIIEVGDADKYRPLIVVECSLQNQMERLMVRNSLTESEALARINSQMLTSEKIKYADYIINTDQTKEVSQQLTIEVINKLRNMS